MTRPWRNRLLLFAIWAALVGAVSVLPGPLRLVLLGAVGCAAMGSYLVARDFFAAKNHLRKKRWVEALVAFDAFEQAVAAAPWKLKGAWLAASVYSHDPVAVAKNGAGVVHLENGRGDLAEASFRAALERDPLYAVPHVNLALAAARRGDAAVMEQNLEQARRLGVTSKKAHARVRARLSSGQPSGR